MFESGATFFARDMPEPRFPSISPSPYWPRTALCSASSGDERLDRLQYLRLLVADRVGLERNRRLHRGQRHELEDMIRDHVPQRAGRVVIAAALLDAELLRRR